MTPGATPVSSPSRSRSAAAEASGSSGSRITVPGPFAFEASTPAEAQTKPCRVRAITSGGRERTTSADSRRITSTCRGSPSSPASSTARGDGSTSSRRTTRPSTFDTAFWATTTTSPSSSPPTRAQASASSAAEVVSLLELGNARQADHPHLAGAPVFVLIQHKRRSAQWTPVTRRPACAL